MPNPSFSNVGFVDCVSKTAGGEEVDIENIKIISSPADL